MPTTTSPTKPNMTRLSDGKKNSAPLLMSTTPPANTITISTPAATMNVADYDVQISNGLTLYTNTNTNDDLNKPNLKFYNKLKACYQGLICYTDNGSGSSDKHVIEIQ